MPIVSISKAAKLTGKARSTIQTYIKAGKLSKTTDATTGASGIEISELLRVFGAFSEKENGSSEDVVIIQQTTGQNNIDTTAFEVLKKENEMLKKLIEEKDKRLLLLENTRTKQWWKFLNK